MRITILLILSLLLTNIYGQDTFSEFDKTNEGFEIEKVKNSDLKLIKEICRDKSGKIVKLYNYNPTTGELDGEFNNGIFQGIYKNNLITSDNYVHFFNPSNSSTVLILKGKIVDGKFNGKYNVYLRKYDTEQQYDHNSTVLNSYIRGEYTKTYSTYVKWTKYVDNIVGEMNFENGLYESFDYAYENKQYKGKYKAGFLDYYIIKDLSSNRNIDSFKVAGKIYLQGGSFQKNSAEKLEGMSITLIDTLEKVKLFNNENLDYKTIGLRNYSPMDYHVFQKIPLIDPLNLSFSMIKRKGYNSYANFINYIDNAYTKINFVPLTQGVFPGESTNIGTCIKDEGLYSLPSNFKLTALKTVKYDEFNILIPFFEHDLNLNRLVELYGTIKGYKILNDFYEGKSEKQLELLSSYTTNNNQKQATFRYSDLIAWENRINQTLETWVIEKDLSDKKEAEKKKQEEIALLAKPQFPGGMGDLMKFIQNNLNYPQTARENGISGKLIFKLFILETGVIDHYEIKRSVNNGEALEKEAIRVIKLMPKWIPGEVEGKKISSTIDIPFDFKLN